MIFVVTEIKLRYFYLPFFQLNYSVANVDQVELVFILALLPLKVGEPLFGKAALYEEKAIGEEEFRISLFDRAFECRVTNLFRQLEVVSLILKRLLQKKLEG